MHHGLRWTAVGLGWAAVAGLAIGCAGLVLDVLRILPGGPTGAGQPPFSLPAFAGRAACLAAAILIVRTVLPAQRRLRAACTRCGRPDPTPATGADRPARVHHPAQADGEHNAIPRWATIAGYLTVAACAIRIAAEIVTWRLPATPANVASVVIFAVGMALAGTLLPLALVHRWGRVWPRWVLPLAGRRVPRWLVLGPALFVAGGLTSIFGPELITMMRRPPESFGGFGVAFLWVAIASYTMWGMALGVAAVSYFQRTRPACAACAPDRPHGTAPRMVPAG